MKKAKVHHHEKAKLHKEKMEHHKEKMKHHMEKAKHEAVEKKAIKKLEKVNHMKY